MPPLHSSSKKSNFVSTGCLIIAFIVLIWIGSFGYFLHLRETPTKANLPDLPSYRSTITQAKTNQKDSTRSNEPKIKNELLLPTPRQNVVLPKYEGEKIHIVFSTDCSFFQDWQTLLVYHSAMVIQQPGDITRIASGCSEVRQKELRDLYSILFPQYRVHFTPDFKMDSKTKKKYDFYNKPYGLHHWLLHAEPPVPEDTIVVLIDPDMVLLRPITAQLAGNPLNIYSKTFVSNEDHIPPRIEKGVPSASLYGLGAPWTLPHKQGQINRTAVCGADSPCLKVTQQYGEKYFSVGPPYLLESSDLLRLTEKWTEFVPRVYSHYPELLAEMYAYSMAAAHTKLPHFTLVSYMVSNIDMTGDEAWEYVDALGEGVCQAFDHMHNTNYPDYYYPDKKLPNVLHYCQFYRIGEIGFQKRRLRKKMLTCEGPLLVNLPKDIAKLRYKNRDGEILKLGPKQAKRGAFMLCTVHAAINRMLIYYKHRMCKAGQTINYNMTENLVDSSQGY